MSLDKEGITAVLRDVLGDAEPPITLHEPAFEGNEWAYVKECIDTGWVSSVGSYVDEFERQLAQKCGVKHAVVTMNGTTAIHIALILAGVKTGDEVLIPSLTFVASANAVTYAGAIPHFIESSEETLGVDTQALENYLEQAADLTDDGLINKETGRRISAILPVHIFGHTVDMDPLLALATKYKLQVVEDAAEALGSTYKGRPAGSLAPLAAMSFNGNKIVTTGGGGAFLTDDDDLAARAKHLTTTAKEPHPWAFNHDEIGYNYRMPNINAALGCAQLEKLDEFLEQKRALSARYEEAFKNSNSVRFVKEPEFCQSNYWLNAITLNVELVEQRDELLQHFHDEGLHCRPIWTLMHELPMYTQNPKMDTPVAKSLAARVINIPSSAKWGKR